MSTAKVQQDVSVVVIDTPPGETPVGKLPTHADYVNIMLDSVRLDRMMTYSTSDVARFFFLRSASWLRLKEGEGSFHNPSTGETVKPVRDIRNARRYTLLDIERLAHAMYANGSIQYSQLIVVKNIIWWSAAGGGIEFVQPSLEVCAQCGSDLK